MARKKHGAEQTVAILRQIEVELANHKSTGQAWTGCFLRALATSAGNVREIAGGDW